jgi:hypothetical protein
MAKVGILDARLARLQEQVRKAKEMQSAIRRQRRAVQKEDEKRRIWIVGMCAMAGMRDARVREVVAAELAKDGVLRKEGDAELFADLLAGTYVPTAADDKARRAMELEPAAAEEAAAATVAVAPLAAE